MSLNYEERYELYERCNRLLNNVGITALEARIDNWIVSRSFRLVYGYGKIAEAEIDGNPVETDYIRIQFVGPGAFRNGLPTCATIHRPSSPDSGNDDSNFKRKALESLRRSMVLDDLSGA